VQIVSRVSSYLIYAVTTGVGIVMFLSPFFLPALRQSVNPNQAHAQDSPLMLMFLLGMAFLVLALEVQGQAVSAPTIALLGILVSINAVLRFVDVVMPLPGGFSPIFFLIVMAGYVFGGRFGFLMGALTLLVSGILTGGVGPWLPSQMFTAGWIGLSAPACRPLARWLAKENTKIEIIILAVFTGLWGFLYGAIMNLYFWPYVAGDAGQYWQPGVSPGETLRRYAVFYLATSLWWDAGRAAGNALMLAAVGRPALQALRRFEARFRFVVK